VKFISRNPATEEVFGEYPVSDRQGAFFVVAKVAHAWESWAESSYEVRAAVLNKAAGFLRERKREYARIMAAEMGKPLAQGEGESEKCAWVCEYYADNGEKFLHAELIPTEATKSFVSFEALGPILAIMPWNFPFWQFFRFAAPALMAGNGIVLKHAPNTTGCALALEKVLLDAGLPPHVCRVLIADVDVVGDVIGHAGIAAVTLTGSTGAGRAVAERAGRHLKKAVLELGGSDPYIILEDADVAEAARICVTSRMLNGGQSCIAAKRFIAVAAVVADFEAAVIAEMKRKTFGNPLTGTFDMGPMARQDLRDQLHGQVLGSIRAGATLALGGTVPPGPGWFYPPTVLTRVPTASPAFREELFGPVAAIISAKDEEEALRLANDSCYGLGAAIFTADTERGEYLANHRLRAGTCAVNDFVRSDPRLPFGGIKESGYGRELSIFGMREFVNAKTVYVK